MLIFINNNFKYFDKNKLKIFDPNLTEWENMQMDGIAEIMFLN
jgi:hypothetical protein